ncbi:RHS repeat domain-containing protein [Pseudomonas kurunegalensis]|uniref:RHS repeat domain-containing protein n=1 Tax=Pseudomonas kurunegalensis TaxID=485880 RepID=UPI002363B3B9|nr:RHS repeat-associated core domain-containing protein [Pseudomonas kurunegalensis]
MSNHVVELIPQPVYVFPYDIDKDPVWLHKPKPKPFGALAWYQCDHLGTPMELTGEDGEIAWSGTYKAWGLAEEKRSEKAMWAEIRNPLRFQGQYWDVETGLHYNRHRYYDPQVGRFIGKDPINFAGGTNVYQYAPNPTQWTDPLGLARSGQWVTVGQGRIRIDPPHVENTDQQVHAHCQCKTRKKEVVVNIDGSQSHKSRGNLAELTRTEKTS